MPLYQATAFFEQLGHGWSESYYRDSGGLTDLAAIADFDRAKIWTKRANCCGTQTTLFAQRASFVTVKNDSVLNYIPLAGNQEFTSEDPATALLIRLGNTDNTLRKNVFMRGIADGAVVEGGKFAEDFASFGALVRSFTNALISESYGWYGSDTKVDMHVGGYTIQANTNRLIFTIDDANLPPEVVGTPIVVRGKGWGGCCKSVLNTTFPCVYFGTDQLITKRAVAAFPYVAPGGFLTRRTYALRVAANARLQKIVERKPGKVSYVAAGRQAARPRG